MRTACLCLRSHSPHPQEGAVQGTMMMVMTTTGSTSSSTRHRQLQGSLILTLLQLLVLVGRRGMAGSQRVGLLVVLGLMRTLTSWPSCSNSSSSRRPSTQLSRRGCRRSGGQQHSRSKSGSGNVLLPKLPPLLLLQLQSRQHARKQNVSRRHVLLLKQRRHVLLRRKRQRVHARRLSRRRHVLLLPLLQKRRLGHAQRQRRQLGQRQQLRRTQAQVQQPQRTQ